MNRAKSPTPTAKASTRGSSRSSFQKFDCQGQPSSRKRGAKEIRVSCPDFDLKATLTSGQVFRWHEISLRSWPRRGEYPTGCLAPCVFSGLIGPQRVWVSQEGKQLFFGGTPPAVLQRYLSLDVDLPSVARQIDVDPIIHQALESHGGLRIIRQDPWECLASFILSSFNNIPRLTGMLNRLALHLGEPAQISKGTPLLRGGPPRSVRPAPARRDSLARSPSLLPEGSSRANPARSVDRASAIGPSPRRGPAAARSISQGEFVEATRGLRGEQASEARTGMVSRAEGEGRARADAERSRPRWGRQASCESLHPRGSLHRFPGPERIASASERVLRNLGLGFRAPYLKAAAQRVASGAVDLERWRDLEDVALRRALLTIPGVGEKVVECVMLFAYGRTSSFPVDVWIGRAMRFWYFRRRKVIDRQIREFALGHFGPMCGWAQQYLYHHARISLERTEPSGWIS